MNEYLTRAAERQKAAESILTQLDLLNRWRTFGKPVLVGAVAYGLVVAPDIDLEIFCPRLRIEDGFEILKDCAQHPQVNKARFWNALYPPHHGLYWQLRYIYEGDQEWKIDMWSVLETYDGPCGAKLLEPMIQTLNDSTRSVIIRLKEEVIEDDAFDCSSIQIYRAVLDFGIKTLDELKMWLPSHQFEEEVTDWIPGERFSGKDA